MLPLRKQVRSLGTVGVRSGRDWTERCALHQNVRARFDGPLALHSPFIGMELEIGRWADAGIQVVLENDVEHSPDLLTRLVSTVDHPALGLCLDTGHLHVFSELNAPEWVCSMGPQPCHVHVHDNDRTNDRHWSLSRGTIAFQPFYEASER